MRWIIVTLIVFLIACKNTITSGEKGHLSSLDSNTANATTDNTSPILIQTFTQIPSVINDCNALFVTDTINAVKDYVFVTNLKGTAFIKLNNRVMELKLIKQTNVDKYTVNELYANDEVEVDLKIKQFKEDATAKWNYKGVLIVKRGSERQAISISGVLGC